MYRYLPVHMWVIQNIEKASDTPFHYALRVLFKCEFIVSKDYSFSTLLLRDRTLGNIENNLRMIQTGPVFCCSWLSSILSKNEIPDGRKNKSKIDVIQYCIDIKGRNLHFYTDILWFITQTPILAVVMDKFTLLIVKNSIKLRIIKQ